MKKDIVILVTGFLSTLLLFLGTINVYFEWFTMNSINAFGALLGAGIALAGALFAVYKNTYAVTRKARKQKALLERNGLK
jgi:protein-S-isoprenylcysteine O-methyltransferase Ste14